MNNYEAENHQPGGTAISNEEQKYQVKYVMKLCGTCYGTGKLKAGQLAIDPSSKRTIQAPYAFVICEKCGGLGYQIRLKHQGGIA